MTTMTHHPAAWWQTAPNPPCASWCTISHNVDEFSEGGTLLFRRTIAFSTTYTVEVQQCTGTTEADDAYEVDRPSVWQCTDADEMSEADAHEFGMALVRAGDLIRRSAR